ncbi:MAG: PIN/TRAM domain-containing protein, partial [Patescibacteria group bacterium]|nr:PIN/TRAM domain-containing protein [Patescibacteria group bacterium]
MVLIILRCLFVLVAAGLAVSMIKSGLIPDDSEWMAIAALTGMLLLSSGVITLDVCIRRKEVQTITAVYFGMIVGFFLAYVVGIALIPLPMSVAARDNVQLVLGLVFCYACISLLLQTKNDFRFIIPYVEFAKEVKRLKPCILDTSVVIDGRIADVVETSVFDGQLIMP